MIRFYECIKEIAGYATISGADLLLCYFSDGNYVFLLGEQIIQLQ